MACSIDLSHIVAVAIVCLVLTTGIMSIVVDDEFIDDPLVGIWCIMYMAYFTFAICIIVRITGPGFDTARMIEILIWLYVGEIVITVFGIAIHVLYKNNYNRGWLWQWFVAVTTVNLILVLAALACILLYWIVMRRIDGDPAPAVAMAAINESELCEVSVV